MIAKMQLLDGKGQVEEFLNVPSYKEVLGIDGEAN